MIYVEIGYALGANYRLTEIRLLDSLYLFWEIVFIDRNCINMIGKCIELVWEIVI